MEGTLAGACEHVNYSVAGAYIVWQCGPSLSEARQEWALALARGIHS